MESPIPSLIPLFRSASQARLLARVFLNDEALSLSHLAEATGLPLATVHREIDRLDRAGLVRSDRIGNVRRVHPNEDSPYYQELWSLLLKAFGPVSVLREALAGVSDLSVSYIYGSWADRYLTDGDSAPADLEVVVVGSPDRNEVQRACLAAAAELGVDIAPTVVSQTEWDSARRVFVRTIRDGPLLPIGGEPR